LIRNFLTSDGGLVARTSAFFPLIMPEAQAGELSWRLSSHPITLLTFLGFRIGITLQAKSKGTKYADRTVTASLLVYLLGMLFTQNLFDPLSIPI
jgi:hypothetical protein